MTSFVETATLRVVNQASKEIRKINTDLNRLFGTANKAKKALRDIGAVKVNTTQVTGAIKRFGDLSRVATRTQKSLQLTGNIRLQTFNGALTKLDQLTKKAQTTERALANMGRGMNTRTRQPGGIGGGPWGGGGGRVQLEYGMFARFADGFIGRLGATIERSIVDGFAKGTERVDRSQMRLEALGYSPETIAKVETSISQIQAQNPWYSRSQVREQYAELGPILGKDPMRSTQLVNWALEYGNVLQTQGRDPEQSLEGVKQIIKALDNMNRLNGPNNTIDPAAYDYLRTIMQETIRAGGDITPERINTAVVYSRSIGKTMSPEGLATMIRMLESMGRVAGSSINRFATTYKGFTTKAAVAAQEDFGLTETKQVVTGTSNGKPVTETRVERTAGAELLDSDPNMWVVQELIPRLIAKGIDINDRSAVAEVLDPLAGSVVARDVAAMLVSWQDENKSATEAAQNTVVDPNKVREILNNSPVKQWQGLTNNATELLGTVGKQLGDVFVPALSAANSVLNQLTQYIGENGPLAALAATAAGGGTLYAGAKAGGALLDVFGLKGSALALNGSAALLSEAAIKLGAAGNGQPESLGDFMGGKNGRRNTSLLALATFLINNASKHGEVTRLKDENGNEKRDSFQRFTDWITGQNQPTTNEKLTQTLSEIENVKAEIKAARESGAGAYAVAAEEELHGLEAYAQTLRTESENSALALRQSLESGTDTMVAGIANSAPGFIANLQGGLSGIGTQIGSDAAAAFNANANVTATVEVKKPADTGQNFNGAR